MDRQTDRQADSQTDNGDFIGPSIGRGSKNYNDNCKVNNTQTKYLDIHDNNQAYW